MPSGDQKMSKIQTEFQTLSTEAKSLNAASDELSKTVGVLDDALKRLSVGLPVWVEISHFEENDRSGVDKIGYCKVNGKWGIALIRVDDEGRDESEGPWLFNDAPRELRVSGVDKIPEVIVKLAQETARAARLVEQKTKDVRDIATALTQIVNDSQGLKLSASFVQSTNALKPPADSGNPKKHTTLGDLLRLQDIQKDGAK